MKYLLEIGAVNAVTMMAYATESIVLHSESALMFHSKKKYPSMIPGEIRGKDNPAATNL